jgi:hypothetical protein
MTPTPDIEWAKLSWTMITALATGVAAVATGIWAVLTWVIQRMKDRKIERQRTCAFYVHPFMFAADELQSRLYNILELRGLEPLTDPTSPHAFAEETVYLIAQYLGWERSILRHGPYTGDAQIVRLISAIRDAFATDKLGRDIRFFRPDQGAIAQLMMRRAEGQLGVELEVMPFHEFLRAFQPAAPLPRTIPALLGWDVAPHETPPLAEITSLSRAVAILKATRDPEKPPAALRLVQVQTRLVELLTYLEDKEKLSLFDGVRRVASEEKHTPANWSSYSM